MLSIHNEVDTEFKYKESLKLKYRHNKALLMPARINKQVLNGLSNFQQILLITDGTVTELLEYYLGESIKVKKLYERLESDIKCLSRSHIPYIDQNDFPVLERKVLLQGDSTLRNWLYAETSILIDRLPLEFRDDLMISNKPIGKLWSKYRFETYKNRLHYTKRKKQIRNWQFI